MEAPPRQPAAPNLRLDYKLLILVMDMLYKPWTPSLKKNSLPFDAIQVSTTLHNRFVSGKCM